jgi:hypothetical protein
MAALEDAMAFLWLLQVLLLPSMSSLAFLAASTPDLPELQHAEPACD